MTTITLMFFGSSSDSVIVLNTLSGLRLHDFDIHLAAVVTQPPRPVGRKQILTPTPVEIWGKEHAVTTLSFPSNPANPSLFENEQTVIDTLSAIRADLLVSASYGQKIPFTLISEAKYGGLNIHPSLLPRWRGADPVPWAILSGDHQTGVTIVTLSEKFDQGKLLAQKKRAISVSDETDPLRAELFALGAGLLAETIPDILNGKLKGTTQDKETATYARRLTRQDGFVAWEVLLNAIQGTDVPPKDRPPVLAMDMSHITITIVKALHALSPWPGLWTNVRIPEEKRLKILACHMEPVTNMLVLDTVQLEGKKPVPWQQFTASYSLDTP